MHINIDKSHITLPSNLRCTRRKWREWLLYKEDMCYAEKMRNEPKIVVKVYILYGTEESKEEGWE